MNAQSALLIAGIAILVQPTDTARAQSETHLCFDELPLAHVYSVGDEFKTLGVDVTVTRFFAVEGVPIFSGSASSEHFQVACQTEETINMSLTEAALGFKLTTPATRLEFQFGDFSNVLNLEVNGELALFHGFDNAPPSLGGATITGTITGPGGIGQICGKVVIEGEISSLKIGGDSLWLDCVTLSSPAPAGTRFVRGDTNATGNLDMSDAVSVLGYLFLGKPTQLVCDDAADVNDDGAVQLSDAVAILNFLFLGSRAPAAPFPECGLDGTDDTIDCNSFAACVGK